MKFKNTKGELVDFNPMPLDQENKGHGVIIAPSIAFMSTPPLGEPNSFVIFMQETTKKYRKLNSKQINVTQAVDVADHFIELQKNQKLRFSAPKDATENWMPEDYRLVTNPKHILLKNDCVLPALDNNWRLLSSINNGKRIGLIASNVGDDIVHIATKKTD